MENLSDSNLFTSHFVMGCYWNRKTDLDCINSLSEWLEFKDTDYGMKRYRSDRTQYVSFLDEIDLKELKLIIEDLISIYKKSYPYGTKEDFIEHIFSYTLFDMEKFITREYIGLGFPSKINYQYYNYYDLNFNEFLDFATPEKKTIEHFKQYYKQVIALINNIPFTKKVESNSTPLDEESLKTTILKVNKKNSKNLSEEYDFSEDDRLFIYRTFWPIIVIEKLDFGDIQKQLTFRKQSFIQTNGTFDIEIFKREELDYLLYELNEFSNCMKRGQSRIWDNRNGDNFHWFKLEMDTANAQTLVISKCNEIQLEMYFKGIATIINDFLEVEKVEISQSISNPQTTTEFANVNNLPPQQKEETTQKELIQLSQAENKFIKVPMQEVINHFRVFTTAKNKEGENYLTEDQFISFLKKCFLDYKNEPIQKINFTTTEKGYVIKRFYEFYQMATRQYSIHNAKAPFIDRFTECIEFGEKSTFISFFKNNKTKNQW